MQYWHYDFNGAKAGDRVRVDIDIAANVILVDDFGFHSYRSGGQYRYWGGQARRTPILLTVPYDGNWHLVIDLGGGSGTFRHSAVLIPAA